VDIPVSSLWHRRLGHLSKAGITHLSKAGYIPKLSFLDHQFCEHCQYGKHVAVPHPTSTPRESSALDLVDSNICGPMPHSSLDGASYFGTFIDDATRKVWAYPSRTKDRVFTILKDWLAMVENQTDRKLKCLRSDNGGEYKSDEFVQFCREHGIKREFTAPHSAEQNGVAERMNRTIQEWIVSMLHHSGLFLCFWAGALITAVRIMNMSPNRPLGSKIS
jgi:transposase InsO family protein